MPPADEEWLRQLRDESDPQHPHAFELLYRHCLLACQSQKDRLFDVEDIAFGVACSVFERVTTPGYTIYSLKAYIAKVARLRCIDEWRKQTNEGKSQPPLPFPTTFDPPAAELRPGSSPPANDEALSALAACIAALSEREQNILHWYMADRGPKWIAEQIGPPMNQGYVSVIWNKIRKKLKGCVGERGR